jgi:hypothetical protein
MSLSEWIRKRCNGEGHAVSDKELQRATEVPVARRRASVLERLPALAETPTVEADERVRKGKFCKHGTEKGYRCWQCGGLAIIE